MTSLSLNGLSVIVRRPLILGGNYIGDLTEDINDYSHVAAANGGYISSDFSITGNSILVDDWLQYGLGRHIVVNGPSVQPIWEGFVNQIDVTLGGVSFTRGPLTNVVNRISAIYTPYLVSRPNMCLNQGFETLGGGGVDVFDAWSENAGDGAIAEELVLQRSGLRCLRMTSGASLNTSIYQNITCPAGDTIVFSFWSRGDGVNACGFGIYDTAHTAWIVLPTSTGNTTTDWVKSSASFTAPAGFTSAVFYFWPDVDGAIVYVDDVTVTDMSAEGETITGTPVETIIEEDLDSQAKYGIWEKVLNLGNAWEEDAYEIQGLYLVENANPEASNTLSIGNTSGDISVKVKCRGYIDWLSGYVYNYNCDEPITITYVYASDKIIAVLSQDPNNVFSTTYNNIDANLVIQADSECEDKLAKTIIDDSVALGGGDDSRWTFGIYANRKPVYKAIPTTVEYLYRDTSSEQEIETISGDRIRPWDVLPGKWVAVPDVLSSSGIKITTPRDDPRVFFAEEVTFTAPDKVTVSGAKIRRLSQYLSKLGMGGV